MHFESDILNRIELSRLGVKVLGYVPQGQLWDDRKSTGCQINHDVEVAGFSREKGNLAQIQNLSTQVGEASILGICKPTKEAREFVDSQRQALRRVQVCKEGRA